MGSAVCVGGVMKDRWLLWYCGGMGDEQSVREKMRDGKHYVSHDREGTKQENRTESEEGTHFPTPKDPERTKSLCALTILVTILSIEKDHPRSNT
jgi:hypothetical protein